MHCPNSVMRDRIFCIYFSADVSVRVREQIWSLRRWFESGSEMLKYVTLALPLPLSHATVLKNGALADAD